MPNPWLLLGGVLLSISLTVGAFFYGRHTGVESCQAGQLNIVAGQFQQFAKDAGTNAKNGTAQALADFNKRAGILEAVANDLRTSKGIMDNAASRLKASLAAGSCVLSPDQRRMLECIRRPGDTACTAPDL